MRVAPPIDLTPEQQEALEDMLDLAKELADVRLRKPWPSGMFSKVLLKADDLRLVLIAMENGAIMKEHAANGTVAIHAFEGALCVHTPEQAYDLNEGQVLTLAPGMKHDVEAREDCAFLLTIAWCAMK